MADEFVTSLLNKWGFLSLVPISDKNAATVGIGTKQWAILQKKSRSYWINVPNTEVNSISINQPKKVSGILYSVVHLKKLIRRFEILGLFDDLINFSILVAKESIIK